MSLRPRSRNSFIAGAAVSIAALLGLAIVPAASADEVVIVPTPVGTAVTVSATVDGTVFGAKFGQVFTAGDTYLETVALDGYEPAPFDATSGYVFVLSSTADWVGSSVVVCLSYDPADVAGDPAFLVRTYDPDTDTRSWVDRTTSIPTSGTICGLDEWATYSGEYILGFTPAPFVPGPLPIVTDDFELSLDRVVGSNVFAGDPDAISVHLRIANLSADQDLRIGLALDLAVEGVPQKLWLAEDWGALADDSGIDELLEFFSFPTTPGEVLEFDGPSWPGKTYSFYLLDDILDEGEYLGSYTADGGFVPIILGSSSGFGVTIGTEATVTGGTPPEIFPGVTATVEAEGLTPGETLQFWMAPGLDYFWFYLLGANLPDDAIYVGSGTVGAGGTLASTFDLPPSTAYGTYQLILGDPATRYWPAGSAESFEVQFAASSDMTTTPTGNSVPVSVSLDDTLVNLLFPTVTTAGSTSVAASTTGPVIDTFILTSSPQIYYHIDSTATFTGLVQVCITYDPLTLTGGIPYLYHYKDLGGGSYQWQNITTSRVAGLVCGLTDSFSPFTLGFPNPEVVLTTKQECKNGGWATSTLPIFKNQGDCVSYFASRGPKSKSGS